MGTKRNGGKKKRRVEGINQSSLLLVLLLLFLCGESILGSFHEVVCDCVRRRSISGNVGQRSLNGRRARTARLLFE